MRQIVTLLTANEVVVGDHFAFLLIFQAMAHYTIHTRRRAAQCTLSPDRESPYVNMDIRRKNR